MVSQSLFEPMIRATFAVIAWLSSRESRVLYGNYRQRPNLEANLGKSGVLRIFKCVCEMRSWRQHIVLIRKIIIRSVVVANQINCAASGFLRRHSDMPYGLLCLLLRRVISEALL